MHLIDQMIASGERTDWYAQAFNNLHRRAERSDIFHYLHKRADDFDAEAKALGFCQYSRDLRIKAEGLREVAAQLIVAQHLHWLDDRYPEVRRWITEIKNWFRVID